MYAPTAELDLSTLTSLVGDDPAVIDEVLRSFQRCAAQSRNRLRSAMAAGSMKSGADVAHNLKSAALAIGAMPLGALCAQIEEAAQAQTRAQVQVVLLPLYEAELDAVGLLIEATRERLRRCPCA